MRTKDSVAVFLATLFVFGGADVASAQKKPAPTKPKPAAPKPAVGTVGTKQMAGTEGQIGVTYSLKDRDFVPRFNMTLTSVTYSTKRFSYDDRTVAATTGEKFLVLRYVVQNPNKEDIEIGSYRMANNLFQAVGSDNKTYIPEEEYNNTFLDLPNLAPGKKYPDGTVKLKPGQKSETIVALIPIPADITVPKIIVNRGRVGTSEEVVRFDVRDKIKSDFGIFADAANPAVPIEIAPAQAGTAYSLINLEVNISDLKREAGPLIEDITADEGKEFITGVITLRNVSPQTRYFWVDCKPVITLVDADGEKVTFDADYVKNNRTGRIEVGNVESLDSRKGIFYFQVPKGIKYKQILVQEKNFPDYLSRRLVFDISNL